MRFSYEKLWHLLLDKHMTREQLRTKCGISSNSIAKLGKGQNDAQKMQSAHPQ